MVKRSTYQSAATSIACIVSAAVAGFFGGQVGASTTASSEVSDELRTRRLYIVDESGKERASLYVGGGSENSRVGLWMRSPSQKGPSINLWIDNMMQEPQANLSLLSSGREPGSGGQLLLRSFLGLPSVNLTYATNRSIVLGPDMLGDQEPLRVQSGGK